MQFYLSVINVLAIFLAQPCTTLYTNRTIIQLITAIQNVASLNHERKSSKRAVHSNCAQNEGRGIEK